MIQALIDIAEITAAAIAVLLALFFIGPFAAAGITKGDPQ